MSGGPAQPVLKTAALRNARANPVGSRIQDRLPWPRRVLQGLLSRAALLSGVIVLLQFELAGPMVVEDTRGDESFTTGC